jgi:pyruvate carboxylase
LSIETVRQCGKIAEVGICFTGDFLSEKEKIYTLEYYKDMALKVSQAGAHMIGLKDMAGLLKPQMAKPLVEAIRSVTDLPLHFHCHNTSSAGLATAIAMADAGCEVIDFALASMADTTSQPSMNAFLAAMKGHPKDPQIDYLSLERLDQYWDQCRTLYQPFESGLKSGTARVYDHQIPGGQYSNLIAQAKSMGTFDRWERVVDMYRDVNQMFGDIIKVTPSSKCVGDMAIFMITNNLTVEDLKGPKGDIIEFPTSVVSLCKGYLGFPHHGLPEWIVQKVLKGEKQLTARPGSLLPPIDFNAVKAQLEAKYSRALSQEDLLSCILYPAVMDDFFKFENEFGSEVMHVPTTTFFYGLKIGESISLGLPGLSERFEHLANTTVTLKRVCPADLEGNRVVIFELSNGNRVEIRVKDKTMCTSSCELPQADASKSEHVPSPLQGVVAKVFVSQGHKVRKGDPIMTVSAMKMEVIVKAVEDGIVNKLLVTEGMKVDSQSLLAIVQ